MQVRRLDDLWLLSGYTRQNYPFILTGYAASPQAYSEIFNAGLAMKALAIPEACHPVTLDLLLANLLQAMAGTFPVAGCTISVPGVPGASGGVLGDPASTPASSAGLIEDLSMPWSLVTFSGGPGMAQNIKLSSLPVSVKSLCTSTIPDHSTLEQLSVYTKSIGADKFIAITDGSGPGACGAALIRSRAQKILLRLEEVEK